MIELQQVTKAYGSGPRLVRALDDVTLRVEGGEYVAIRGHSGSGKSTLLSLVGGLAMPSSGTVTVDGRPVSSMSAGERARFRAENVGFVFQMFHLLPYLNIRDNILVGAADPGRAAARAGELIGQFGLAERESHRPGELSAGERQRAAMARALLNQPPLLLADEPTGNLDPKNAESVMEIVDQFHRDGGTVLLVTHNRESAARAQRIVTLEKGQLVETPSAQPA